MGESDKQTHVELLFFNQWTNKKLKPHEKETYSFIDSARMCKEEERETEFALGEIS